MTLVGSQESSQCINCVLHVLPVFAGYALGMIWLRHYFCGSSGGRIAAIIIGVIAAVPVGNFAAGIFLNYFPQLRYMAADWILFLSIGTCVMVCMSLLSPPTAGGTTQPPTPPGGYP